MTMAVIHVHVQVCTCTIVLVVHKYGQLVKCFVMYTHVVNGPLVACNTSADNSNTVSSSVWISPFSIPLRLWRYNNSTVT